MTQRFSLLYSDLPPSYINAFKAIFDSNEFVGVISATQFQTLKQATGLDEQQLKVALLPFAAAYSIAPISQFHVGAIVKASSDTLYFGANLECSGVQLGQTIHAEQSAISHAWMNGEQGIKDITINFSPCGHCRQFMNELTTAEHLTVQLPKREEMTLQQYLPESFGPKDLGIESALMSSIDHGYQTDQQDPLINKAINALNTSHAPYSKNYSGVAIKTKQNRFFSGSYAENAAFNPSLPPLQVALVQLQMVGIAFSDIVEIALVEMMDASISHLAETQSTLEAINPDIPVAYVAIEQ
ncbi:cytidine deaminase [Vibrio sp. UCD-FRSSP16_10]|uniref:cytidine deaminase n=1 Tax=unclassified Vibrio TaxID=2614977 RepID=UPI0007FE9CDA|nr:MULTISPECIES: cytidine deaminase [unclassified Vibrio]OBT12124.1 cytidine deaminase [Vibrio sp. UCD-FRSSP16_30]OBT20455.1 cytidine deaminase [Vibrio sp. UCD-FRSSP16_10]